MKTRWGFIDCQNERERYKKLKYLAQLAPLLHALMRSWEIIIRLSHTLIRIFKSFHLKSWEILTYATIQRGKLNKNFLHFRHFKIWQKMKKILVQLFFNSLLLHKGTKKNPNSGYISTIFFPLSCYVWFHEKSQMAKKNNNS